MLILACLFVAIVFWLPLGVSIYKGFSPLVSILFAILGLAGGTLSALLFLIKDR